MEISYIGVQTVFDFVMEQAETLPHPFVDAVVMTTTLIRTDNIPFEDMREQTNVLLSSISSELLKLASDNTNLVHTKEGIEQLKNMLFNILVDKYCFKSLLDEASLLDKVKYGANGKVKGCDYCN